MSLFGEVGPDSSYRLKVVGKGQVQVSTDGYAVLFSAEQSKQLLLDLAVAHGVDRGFQYGVRYDEGDGGEVLHRGFSSRGNAMQRLVAEYGDKLVRRVAAVTIPAGEWEEVPEGE